MTAEPSGALARGALFAVRAPSLHNSQPWHWHVTADTLDLRLEPARVLHTTDPDGRLAVLSCGTALQHVRAHLAAAGHRVTVARTPSPTDPHLLARIRLAGRAEADHDAMRLVGAASRRRTDRHALPGAPIDLHRVRSVRQSVLAAGADLFVLRPSQVFAIAAAAAHAQGVQAADPGWQAEVAQWVGGDRPTGAGVPAVPLQQSPWLVTSPARVLRRGGPTLITEAQEHAAVFAVLHTAADEPIDWLVAGEALSAAWLTATALDVAVLPLSVVTEVSGSRERIRRLLAPSGHPHLVLRLTAGVADDGPRTPRLPASTVVTFR